MPSATVVRSIEEMADKEMGQFSARSLATLAAVGALAGLAMCRGCLCVPIRDHVRGDSSTADGHGDRYVGPSFSHSQPQSGTDPSAAHSCRADSCGAHHANGNPDAHAGAHAAVTQRR